MYDLAGSFAPTTTISYNGSYYYLFADNTSFSKAEGQVWGCRAEPLFGIAFIHGIIHERTNFGFGIEHQIGLVQILRDTQISRYAIVARVLQRVTPHAVVRVERCATLE